MKQTEMKDAGNNLMFFYFKVYLAKRAIFQWTLYILHIRERYIR